jgi:hypothetical protein
MATKNTPGGLSIDLSYELDIPGLGKLKIEAEPEELKAAESLIRTTIEASQGVKAPPVVPAPRIHRKNA